MTTITTLSDLISQVESNGNPLAVRFEPAHNPAAHFVLQMQSLCSCSYDTAKTLCAMSWGEFQIMGDELIALGLSVSPLAYVQDRAMQEEFFQRYVCADHLSLTLQDVLTDPAKRSLFARLYNGPGNVDAYATRMALIAQHFGLQVTT